jgi:hypothetical protein
MDHIGSHCGYFYLYAIMTMLTLALEAGNGTQAMQQSIPAIEPMPLAGMRCHYHLTTNQYTDYNGRANAKSTFKSDHGVIRLCDE